MRAGVVALPVTFQVNLPSLAVLLVMDAQEAPPSRETWIFTLPVSPLEVHWIAWYSQWARSRHRWGR